MLVKVGKQPKDSRDNLETDPSWELLGTEFSCVFPATFEPDPAIVRAIRVFDPDFVPVWCVKEYKAPTNQRHEFGWYILGRHVPIPNQDPWAGGRERLRLLTPTTGFHFKGGIYEDTVWASPWPPGSIPYKLGLPYEFLSFDWDLVDQAREQWWKARCERFTFRSNRMAEYNDARAAKQSELASVQEDARLRLRDDKRQIRKAISEGNILPDPWEKKPFVSMGS